MTRFFSKIIGIVIGLVFLLGGAFTAFGATEYVWVYQWKADGGVNTPIQTSTFSTEALCRADLASSTMYSKTPCTMTIKEMATQLEANEAQRQADIAAAHETATGGAFEQAGNIFSQIKSCSWDNLMDCVMYLPLSLSYVLYILTAGVLTLSGYLFDATLTLGIDKDFILKPFVDTTWVIVRDFSNMAFIFVLLFTGVQTILGIGGWQKTIRNVIIIALLINFSLFFTKVVIDAGNILAVGVYNSIGVVKTSKDHTSSAGGSLKERDLSSALVSAFGPGTFLAAPAQTKSASLGVAIFIIGAIVNILVAFAFFRVALLFTGRIIGFWFLMIISPFAFISMTFPKGNVFNEWLKNLLGLSFVAPVFLFFLYLIMKVLAEGRLFDTLVSPSTGSAGAFSFDVFFVPVVMVIFIYIALEKSVSFSKDMAGSFGDIGSKITSTALGLTGGVATGGASMLGRGVIGGYAARKLADGTLKEGSWQHSLATGATKASFDVRSLAGEKSILGKKVGGMISKGGGALGVDVGKATLGGVEKEEKDRAKKATDNVPQMSIFEEQGARARAKESEAGQKRNLEESEKVVEINKKTVEVATKKVTDAQASIDTMRNSGDVAGSLRMKKVLDAAKEEEVHAKEVLEKSEKKRADEAEKKVDAEKEIKKENERRRNAYADKVEKSGRHATAAKIRKGEESGQAKTAKRLAAEKKKEEEREGGARPDVLASIEEKIEENKKKE